MFKYIPIIYPRAEETAIGQSLGLTKEDLDSPANHMCLHIQLARYVTQGRAVIVPDLERDRWRIARPLRFRFYFWDEDLMSEHVHVMLNPECSKKQGRPIMVDAPRVPLEVKSLHGKPLFVPAEFEPRLDLLAISLWFMFLYAKETRPGLKLPAFDPLTGKFSTAFRPVNDLVQEDIKSLCTVMFAEAGKNPQMIANFDSAMLV